MGVVDTRHYEGALQVKEPGPRLLLPQDRCIVSHSDNFMRRDCDGSGPLSMRLTQTHTGQYIAVVIDRDHRLGSGCEQRGCQQATE